MILLPRVVVCLIQLEIDDNDELDIIDDNDELDERCIETDIDDSHIVVRHIDEIDELDENE